MLLVVIAGEEQHSVAFFVFREVVGVGDILAILFGSFGPLPVFVVFFGELALT